MPPSVLAAHYQGAINQKLGYLAFVETLLSLSRHVGDSLYTGLAREGFVLTTSENGSH